MGARLQRSGWAFVLAVVGLLSCQAGKAEAHPSLEGNWAVRLPGNGYMAFYFCAGTYLGDGIWRGSYSYAVSFGPVYYGQYELKMFTATEGALSIKSGLSSPGWTVGSVDFAIPQFMYLNAYYRR
jgi:hypothetical protein